MSDKTDKTSFGDRMKAYERVETEYTFPIGKPIYARLDGHCFSNFTKGMKRPYDEAMSEAMILTTIHMVKETNASIGYVQSDEISLVWEHTEDRPAYFNGRKDKMLSLLAAKATNKFSRLAEKHWPEKCELTPPELDARVFQLPSLEEATNEILWRCIDARKNSISMAAHHHLGHRAIHGKNGLAKIEMLKVLGIDWHEYPDFFKYGTFVQRVTVNEKLSDEELMKIPEKHRHLAKKEFSRNKVEVITMPFFVDVKNRSQVVFNRAKAIV